MTFLIFISAFLYLAGAAKTMIDYEIVGAKQWALLIFWPFFYAWLMADSLWHAAMNKALGR